MRKFILAAAFSAIPLVASAAAYLPTGVQFNVAKSVVTSGGWTQCYQGIYGESSAQTIDTILSGCTGDKLMLAASIDGQNLSLLAQADYADVTFATGGDSNHRETTHLANGTQWYYSQNWSWGFADDDSYVYNFSCDFGDSFDGTSGQDRLCWHTGANHLNYGYRAGNDYNGNTQRLVYSFTGNDAAVPEPATWALMIGGFGLAGAGLRRRKAAAG